MSDSTVHTPRTRRTVLTAAAWGVPVVAMATAAPAMAASTASRFDVVFDGGGGSNGYANSTYLNLRSNTGSPITLSAPITITVDVVATSGSGEAERSFVAGASEGRLVRSSYNPAIRTTTITWTLPAGTVIPTDYIATSNPDIFFTFHDGLHSAGRIRNKIVVRSIQDGQYPERVFQPVDSSIQKDYRQGRVSPDGIY